MHRHKNFHPQARAMYISKYAYKDHFLHGHKNWPSFSLEFKGKAAVAVAAAQSTYFEHTQKKVRARRDNFPRDFAMLNALHFFIITVHILDEFFWQYRESLTNSEVLNISDRWT